MEEEADIINYYHNFNTLSKPLLKARQMTEGKCNAIFWCGFHPDDQFALQGCLIAKQPDRPRGQVFDIQDVLQTARAIFSGDDYYFFQEPPSQRHETDRA
jgi:hypothetical protein